MLEKPLQDSAAVIEDFNQATGDLPKVVLGYGPDARPVQGYIPLPHVTEAATIVTDPGIYSPYGRVASETASPEVAAEAGQPSPETPEQLEAEAVLTPEEVIAAAIKKQRMPVGLLVDNPGLAKEVIEKVRQLRREGKAITDRKIRRFFLSEVVENVDNAHDRLKALNVLTGKDGKLSF